jgi:hypothetical protein
MTHLGPKRRRNGALRSRSLRPVQAPLNVGTAVVRLVAPGVVLSVVGGLHERVHLSRRCDSMAVHVGCDFQGLLC